MIHGKLSIFFSSICLIIAFMSGLFVGRNRGIPFVQKKFCWAIGIYMGDSPFNLFSHRSIENPVLTAKDVTDISAEFVADPFMVKENSWYMFFEVLNARTGQGDIGLAISNDGLNWVYDQIVLDEPFHLSYPYIFKWKNEYYMIPESYHAKSIRLYKAFDFPTQWLFVSTLVAGSDYVDSSIVHFNDKWWLFAALKTNDILNLYYANELTGPWTEHPMSPIVKGDANIARPGGRMIVFAGRIVRYTQDDDPNYGNQLRAFEITKLTTKSYEEKEVCKNPILKASGSGWNSKGMHHMDPHQIGKNEWIACVDGLREKLVFGLKY